jgi:RimJ/RimL family protein N-acetyltransferase
MLTIQPLENEEQLAQIERLERKSSLWVNTPLYVVAHAYFYREHSDVYCFQLEETVIGVVILGKRNGDNGEFTDLVIGDGWLGRGYGKKTVKLILAEYRRLGKRKVKLCVHSENHIAKHIYQSCGFVEISKSDWDNNFVNIEILL